LLQALVPVSEFNFPKSETLWIVRGAKVVEDVGEEVRDKINAPAVDLGKPKLDK